jgi:hypothetical protein
MIFKIAAASAVLLAATVSAQTIVNPRPAAATQAQNVAVIQQQVTGSMGGLSFPRAALLRAS